MDGEYHVDGTHAVWRTFHKKDRSASVALLLDGSDGGPEAVHSVQPNASVPPHFHQGAQFQLVLQGSLQFPHLRLDAIAVHYTDHNVPYGPFTATSDSRMMVVHAKPAGQIYMNEPGATRQTNPLGRAIGISASDITWETLVGHTRVRCKRLIDEPTGLRAMILQGAAADTIDLGMSRFGRFDIVLSGSIDVGGTALGKNSLRFVSGDVIPAPAVCGPHGATVVVLDFDQDASLSYGGSIAGRHHEMQEESDAVTRR